MSERERDRDADALSKTRSLINYLADLTDAANRNPVRDITADVRAAPDPLLWLDEFPEGIELDAMVSGSRVAKFGRAVGCAAGEVRHRGDLVGIPAGEAAEVKSYSIDQLLNM